MQSSYVRMVRGRIVGTCGSCNAMPLHPFPTLGTTDTRARNAKLAHTCPSNTGCPRVATQAAHGPAASTILCCKRKLLAASTTASCAVSAIFVSTAAAFRRSISVSNVGVDAAAATNFLMTCVTIQEVSVGVVTWLTQSYGFSISGHFRRMVRYIVHHGEDLMGGFSTPPPPCALPRRFRPRLRLGPTTDMPT